MTWIIVEIWAAGLQMHTHDHRGWVAKTCPDGKGFAEHYRRTDIVSAYLYRDGKLIANVHGAGYRRPGNYKEAV